MAGTGVNISKANLYAVLAPPLGVGISKSLLYAVIAPPNVAPPDWGNWSFPDGIVDIPYWFEWDIHGSQPPMTYTLTSGSLPDGLTLYDGLENLGMVAGIPTTAGTYEFTLKAANQYGESSKSFSLTVNETSWVAITDLVSVNDVRFGVPLYPGGATGLCHVPTLDETLYGISVDVSDTGTVTLPNTDGSTTDASLVRTTAHFGPGNATQGTLDLSLYVLKTNVVDASWVVVGHDNYVGGSAGTYPTTETSKAEQLAEDIAAVEAQKANILDTATILTVTGTYNVVGDYDEGYADGQTDQHAADAAYLEAHKDEILVDDPFIFAEFAVTGTALQEISGHVVVTGGAMFVRGQDSIEAHPAAEVVDDHLTEVTETISVKDATLTVLDQTAVAPDAAVYQDSTTVVVSETISVSGKTIITRNE